MQNSITLAVLVTAMLSIPAAGLGQTSTYDLTSVSGTYSLKFSGYAFEPNGYQDLIVEIGLLSADGAGHVTGSGTLSLNGSIIHRTFSGAYSVNSDGTGSMTLYPSFGPPIDVDTVIGTGGREISLVLTDAANVLSGTMQAQVLKEPSTQTPTYDVTSLTGGYGFSISGYAYNTRGSADPITEVGRLVFDGNGGVAGADTVALGTPVRRTFTGAYTLNADGTGTVVLYPSWGPTIHADLVASARGAKVDFILTDQTNVLAGTMKAQALPAAK